MKIHKPQKSELTNFQRRVLYANYFLDNYKNKVWLIGDGRSGTTWISDLINHDNYYREMFEPFHPEFISEMSFLIPHQYVRANTEDYHLQKIAKDVFSGKMINSRVDSTNHKLIYRGMLVKDIFANLFACWAKQNFSDIKIVLLIRNPFSVALSKFKTKHWFWATEPMDFLRQIDLVEDYLQPFVGLIKDISSKNDYILNQILIWSIINYVPLRQFSSKEIKVIFYEDFYINPMHETSKLLNFCRPSVHGHKISANEFPATRPSRVVGAESNILKGTSPITSWRTEVGGQQIDTGLKILEQFGFLELYDDNSLPRHQTLKQIFDRT